jgi:hypothetical protein
VTQNSASWGEGALPQPFPKPLAGVVQPEGRASEASEPTRRWRFLKEERLVNALEAQGWRFLTAPDSDWIILKQGGRLVAGRSLHTIVWRMEDWNATQNYKAREESKRTKNKEKRENA